MPEHPEDIFLSYSRLDYQKASALRDFFWGQGFTLFIDQNIGVGEEWRTAVDHKLTDSRCVIVAWSASAVVSEEVAREAYAGMVRGVLIPISLDGTPPPKEFRLIQYADISGWDGCSPHAGLARVLAAVARIVRREQRPSPHRVFEPPKTLQENRVVELQSVSDRDNDEQHILDVIRPLSLSAYRAVDFAYDELMRAKVSAEEVVDDRAPLKHYEIASYKLREALDALGERANGTTVAQRFHRPLSYFLKIECANAINFAHLDGNSEEGKKAIRRAIAMYRELAAEWTSDTAVFFRLGHALLKIARTREEVEQGIVNLNKARAFALKDDFVGSDTHWIHFAIPHMISLGFWRISELPSTPYPNRFELIKLTISYSEALLNRQPPLEEREGIIRLFTAKAAGNIVYARSLLAREYDLGDEEAENREEIRAKIKLLTEPPLRNVAYQQIMILDSISHGAVTVRDWPLAREISELICELLRDVAIKRAQEHDLELSSIADELDKGEVGIYARAEEAKYVAAEAATHGLRA